MVTTFFDSGLSVFQITDTGGTLRDISAYVIAIRGLPGEYPLYDVMAFADEGMTSVKGKPNISFEVDLKWSVDANVGPDTVLEPLVESDNAVAFDYGPRGKSATNTKYSGNCLVERFVISSVIGSDIEATAFLRVNGKVTRGTYT